LVSSALKEILCQLLNLENNLFDGSFSWVTTAMIGTLKISLFKLSISLLIRKGAKR